QYISITYGDVLFIDIVAEECKDVDIYGTNTYRGVSFGDMFQVVKDKLNIPVLFTEFGSDAFNSISNQEDQQMQAYYMVGNWKEIYQNAAGVGKVGNSLGGFTFQFSDGWWKYGQTKELDVHNTISTWANGGYPLDLAEGENNMNEEWFGICAKGPTNERGLYSLYPRAAYYALKQAHQLNPYNDGMSVESINNYFSGISLMDAVINARGDKAALESEKTKKVRISGLRAELTTYNTGGDLISTGQDIDGDTRAFPDRLGFDHMESFFVEVEANPTAGVKANISANILGNVATNPINEIFYENRGRPQIIQSAQGDLIVGDVNRLQLYQADFTWNHKQFDLTGFYRTGHYHWGYEGDFFGLYPEANYGPNIDIYNGNAPFGFEINGKKKLKDFKLAFGPELWWGANPALLLKYSKTLGHHTEMTAIFHEDVDEQGPAVSSFAIPMPKTRRATLHLKRKFGNLGVEAGGIWGGQPLVGRAFHLRLET
ncbi:MAG: glycosidase, partial [Bacteroidota bacterium]